MWFVAIGCTLSRIKPDLAFCCVHDRKNQQGSPGAYSFSQTCPWALLCSTFLHSGWCLKNKALQILMVAETITETRPEKRKQSNAKATWWFGPKHCKPPYYLYSYKFLQLERGASNSIWKGRWYQHNWYPQQRESIMFYNLIRII